MSGSRTEMAAAPAKFKYDPALYLYYLNAALALVVAFFPGLNLSHDVQAAIITIATAVLSVVSAVLVRPIHVSVLVAAATTALTAAAAFGLHLSDNRMAALTSALSIVLPLLLRLFVSPAAVDNSPAPAVTPADQVRQMVQYIRETYGEHVIQSPPAPTPSKEH